MTSKTHPTEILIRDARSLLKPTPVELHHIPRWFAKRLRTAMGKHYRWDFPLDDLLQRVENECGSAVHWWDHWGSTTLPNGRRAVVTEPYLSIGDVKKAIVFAQLIVCDVEIYSNSWWYPGQTTRIAFTEPK